MGVDIYGLKPAGTEYTLPDNPTDAQLAEHDQLIWEQTAKLPGGYFHNTWWSWRPIQMLIEIFNRDCRLNIPPHEIEALNSNSGTGISSPEHCKLLATFFREYVEMMRTKGYTNVYLNSGSWWTSSRPASDEMKTYLTQKHEGLFYELPVVDGVTYEPHHVTNIDNLLRFAEFLENCNGFNIH
jgi:hypothetical protein